MTKIGYKHKPETIIKMSNAMKGRIRSAEYRKHISDAKLGEQNGSWVGEKAAYSTVHDWLRKYFSKPEECEYCGKRAKLDWASRTKEYTRNIEEYIALCRGCHIKLDRYRSISV